jgi:arginine utilization protein RocB
VDEYSSTEGNEDQIINFNIAHLKKEKLDIVRKQIQQVKNKINEIQDEPENLEARPFIFFSLFNTMSDIEL